MNTNQRDGTNYYEILEVATDAPQNEIHRAYQRAKSTYSQDNPALYSMFSKEEATELARMIEEAYTVLGNQSTRKAYDESLMKSTPGSFRAPDFKTKNDHQALPDVQMPEPVSGDVSDTFTVRPRESRSSAGPGMGRTPLSNYKIDESFEKEILSSEKFDGLFLQKIRLYKNVSLDKMSEATRVSRAYLTAVEANDYPSLPAPVFVRGFIVNIAKNLALDESKVVNSYMKILKEALGK